jgi:hypothetical protein
MEAPLTSITEGTTTYRFNGTKYEEAPELSNQRLYFELRKVDGTKQELTEDILLNIPVSIYHEARVDSPSRSLHADKTVKILDFRTGFIKIKTSDDVTGWVSYDQLKNIRAVFEAHAFNQYTTAAKEETGNSNVFAYTYPKIARVYPFFSKINEVNNKLSFDNLYDKVKFFYLKGNYYAAKSICREIVRRHPYHTDFWKLKNIKSLDQGEYPFDKTNLPNINWDKPEVAKASGTQEIKLSDSAVRLRDVYQKLTDADVQELVNSVKSRLLIARGSKEPAKLYRTMTISGDQAILDNSTGLMWHATGSEKHLTYSETVKWINYINGIGYAGYGDWRVPTFEEVVSLSDLFTAGILPHDKFEVFSGDDYFYNEKVSKEPWFFYASKDPTVGHAPFAIEHVFPVRTVGRTTN